MLWSPLFGVSSFLTFLLLPFLQAKILYRDGFTEEEKANFKSLILANIFKYVAILLDGRERFEEEDDDLVETRRQPQLNIPSSSSIGGCSDISMSLPGLTDTLTNFFTISSK